MDGKEDNKYKLVRSREVVLRIWNVFKVGCGVWGVVGYKLTDGGDHSTVYTLFTDPHRATKEKRNCGLDT